MFEDTRGAGAGVVVVGAGEAGIGRGDLVVEATHAPHAGELREIVTAGKRFSLAAHALPEVPDEVPFIETIAAQVERVGRRPEVYGGRDASDGDELRGRGAIATEFARELEDEIAAHRKAAERDVRQAVLLDERAHHRAHVARHPAVVERGAEPFGAAAVAHVHADDVHPRGPGFVRRPNDVLRFARAFESVDEDDREGLLALRLPVAAAQHFDVRLDAEQARLGCGQQVAARQQPARDRLRVGAAQQAMRHEWIGRRSRHL